MYRNLSFLIVVFLSLKGFSQYQFTGQMAEKVEGKTVYLSIIEDYRKLSRISFEQIIKKTETDSLGFFKFEGDNLSASNRIYRIHIDECSDGSQGANHFFGSCEYSRSILFIAKNNDVISFPSTFADEVLCELSSTNQSSDAFLEIDALKEEMAIDFHDFRSDASRKLNAEKWFARLQEYGQNLNEPLAELYIYDFLSDKRNQTYAHYLEDLGSNDYYKQLGERLEANYSNTVFTKLYQTEIELDQQLLALNKPSSKWIWLLGSLLLLSLLINFYVLAKRKNNSQNALKKLTLQEQKIVAAIAQDKSNKEIASALFISVSTVKTHINNIYKKLNITSREEIKQRF